MKDRKGNDLSVGDRVLVLPSEDSLYEGPGLVQDFTDRVALIDNRPRIDGQWTKGAWVESERIEKL